jgi:PleD family two-component response regulator
MFDEKEILVVEDTMTQMLIIENLLKDDGFQVECAATPTMALEWFKSNNPRVVLADINLPEMSGYELCKALKQDERFDSVPVILLESLKYENSLAKILDSGADGFIYKHLEEEYFIPSLNKILEIFKQTEKPLQRIDLFSTSVTARQVEALVLAGFNTSVYCSKKLDLLG